jgi:hypothetical protein
MASGAGDLMKVSPHGEGSKMAEQTDFKTFFAQALAKGKAMEKILR